MGALVVLVAVQLSVLGLYLPPVFTQGEAPPQMIISLPVHTAVSRYRASGTLAVLVAVHVSELHGVGVPVAVGVGVGVGAPACAQYLPPVFNTPWAELTPPQTTISLPVQTAVCCSRPIGALVVLVSIQISVLGLYLPPVLRSP